MTEQSKGGGSNGMTLWERIGRSALWCMQQKDWFTYDDFALVAYRGKGKKHSRPGRNIAAFVELGIIEKNEDDRKRDVVKPILYRSKYLVKSIDELEATLGVSLRRQ